MSWQAMEAVQDHSQLEDHTALCIMYAIARSADGNGVVGAGGRATSPNIDTLAERAHCHRNTILNWLPRLEESGELQVERFGKGRGSWNRYTILLPMPDSEPDPEPSEPEPDRIDQLIEMVQGLALMVQGNADKGQETVQETVQNGTSHVGLDTEGDTDFNKNNPVHQLAEHFSNETGFPLPHHSTDNWRIDWLMPLEAMWKKADKDVAVGRRLVTAAIAVNRGDNEQGKTYVVRNPASILTAALNLSLGKNGSGPHVQTINDESGGAFV